MLVGNMIPFLSMILFTLFPLSIARDTITPTQPLLDNETLISSNGSFVLGFFTPSSSDNRYIGTWYNKITARTIVWVANRDKPIINSTGTLSITTTGSLVITDDHNSTIIWSTTALGLTNLVAQLLDNGNFVVGANSETPSWQSFDHPTDTLLPGMKIGVDLSTGLNRILTAWKSDSDPSSGEHYLAMGTAGDFELYLSAGSTKLWRSGPWNGINFGAITDSTYRELFTFSFKNNEQEVTFSYQVTLQAQSRFLVNQSGVIHGEVFLEGTNRWSSVWFAPRDQCDTINVCGPYGQCEANSSPICKCLQGFQPKNPVNWGLGDGSDGCIRNTSLGCDGTDGFLTVNNLKLPANSTLQKAVDRTLSLDDCRGLCLEFCSCTAYAPADISQGGTGCILWVSELTDIKVYANNEQGQDLYVRLAAIDLGLTLGTHAHRSVALAIILSVAGVTLIILSSLGFYLWKRKKTKRGIVSHFFDNNGQDGVPKESDLELPLFDFATITKATNNFSIVNKLGEGGFGPVYKGKLGQDQDIAVKRLSKTSIQGTEEFKNEVILIAKLQHRNLVRLLGYCIQGDERMLIYEYMPNKSLGAFLFDMEFME